MKDVTLKIIAEELKKKGYTLPSVNSLRELETVTEIKILKYIFDNNEVAEDELTPFLPENSSLAMTLSNLKIDNLIVQLNTNYKWTISQDFKEILMKKEGELKESELTDSDEPMYKRGTSPKKSGIRRLVEALETLGITYPYQKYSDLLNIPELEVLNILSEKEEISTTELELAAKTTSSLQMILSNLVGEGLIAQTGNYKWMLSDRLKEALNPKYSPFAEEIKEETPEEHQFFVEQPDNLEKITLATALANLNYFNTVDILEIINKPTFEILNVVNEKQPVSDSEIEKDVNPEILLAMELSNLASDGMIRQDESDYAWVIGDQLLGALRRVKLSPSKVGKINSLLSVNSRATKTKISESNQEELPEVPEQKEEMISKSINDENISDDVSVRPEPKRTDDSLVRPTDLEDPIILLLKEKGYNPEKLKLSTQTNEYTLLKIIAAKGPISRSEIENSVEESESLSMMLSNLSADQLIVEEAYQYAINPKIEARLTKEKPKPESSNKNTSKNSPTENDESLRGFKKALFKLGYASSPDLDDSAFVQIPEFQIIQALKLNEDLSAEQLKQKVSNISPVLVDRTLRKLEADRMIEQKINGYWTLSQKLDATINEDQRRENEIQRLEKEKKDQEERSEKIKNNEEILLELAKRLKEQGILKAELGSPISVLLKEPQFEILALMVMDGIKDTQEIKLRINSTSQVLISRTLLQLEAAGFIRKVDDHSWEIVEPTGENEQDQP